MRYSNYVFTKGSIVFIEVPQSSDKSFLNGRPLIVVSNPTHILNTLVVCTTGTRDKPGIEVSFWNHSDGCYVGNAEVSKIYPYSMTTIYTQDIISSIGQLDPFIMKELDKAIDFHLGRTDEVPGYLAKDASYITEVTHNPVKDIYITEEAISDKLKTPYKNRKERKTFANRYGNFISKTSKKSDVDKYLTDTDITQWIDKIPDPKFNLADMYKDSSRLICSLDEESVAMIVSRIVTVSEVADKYSVNNRIATVLRNRLTEIAIRLGSNYLTGKISPSTNSDRLADHILIGMILTKAFTPKEFASRWTSKFDADMEKISHKYNINTDDRRTWKSMTALSFAE